MYTRRTVVGIAAGLAAGGAGCLDSEAPADQQSDRTPDRNSEPVYVLRASIVDILNGREPVLSTDDDAVADFEPLYSLVVHVAETYENVGEQLTEDEAERFRDLTEGLKYYGAGDPPGYYIDHEGTVVSVSYSEQ